MAITTADVQKAALLARLQLSDQELQTMTSQLADIVAYVDQLSEVDTTDVEPLAHAVELQNVYRSDEARPSLPREEALSNAPRHNGEGYQVPAVLGDS